MKTKILIGIIVLLVIVLGVNVVKAGGGYADLLLSIGNSRTAHISKFKDEGNTCYVVQDSQSAAVGIDCLKNEQE